MQILAFFLVDNQNMNLMDFKERGNKLEISVEEAIKDLQEDIAEKTKSNRTD